MANDEKIMHVAVGIGALETVRWFEEQENEKSARSQSLKNLINNAERVINFYNMNGWNPEKMAIAARCFDRCEAQIKAAFNPKLVDRDEKGRFCKHV